MQDPILFSTRYLLRIMSETRKIKFGLFAFGLLLMAMILLPLVCADGNVCRPRGRNSDYPLWFMLAVMGPFFWAGLSLVMRALGLRLLAAIAGMGVCLAFGLMIEALMFAAGSNACNPGSMALRYVVNQQWFAVSCHPWLTVLGVLIDCFFIGMALEVLRKAVLPPSWREPLRLWVQWMVLLPLTPLLVIVIPLLLFSIGSAAIGEMWRRFRSSPR